MKLPGLTLFALGVSSCIHSSAGFVSPSIKAVVGRNSQRQMFNFFGTAAGSSKYPVVAEESVMDQKAHGTSDKPVQKDLRWSCDFEVADRICNFNRHYAEYAGYWQTTDFIKSLKDEEQPVKFYDSVTGVLLFTAPVGRTMEEFLKESQGHGWPSFRDDEVNWDYVRCLNNGECISTTGTHLGHNLPDGSGNRYCINLVSVAGAPEEE
mmetsp:Transcript_1703/g.3679  ORF Transcript_1703/g.3679 Transcript_1703/m.3679 type:complete len:208 (-) Transcript_1703:1751-2374(-)|eukprot:CAMPEP_0113616846 /NCGR_PEP_ID=MMETSP0017_2-20120614/8457_1 /TAXON_ID=2856 /ORGANISM="Cylindrotheca closterium" /LENGTH=207 /DNA_ID=CAMNT_0000526187 /DNA_START=56 /DNA_END=679 /DNA_ORIENTATION=+ /assembly_acc=CAM_ASM_000147